MQIEDLVDDKWYTVTINEKTGQTLSGHGKALKEYVEWAEKVTNDFNDRLIWGDLLDNKDLEANT